jgi:hypothetical protein
VAASGKELALLAIQCKPRHAALFDPPLHATFGYRSVALKNGKFSSFRNSIETIMNRIIAVPVVLVVFGLSVAQAADIRRISLDGKEGAPAPVAEPG